jgi:hypothetical protein
MTTAAGAAGRQRLLRVERAFPVHETMLDPTANDGINVEMDPTDQFKVWCDVRRVTGDVA